MWWFAEITNHSRDFVEEVVSSRFWHEEKARERNVDTLNKTHYESGIWSVIESRDNRDGDSEIPAWLFFPMSVLSRSSNYFSGFVIRIL